MKKHTNSGRGRGANLPPRANSTESALSKGDAAKGGKVAPAAPVEKATTSAVGWQVYRDMRRHFCKGPAAEGTDHDYVIGILARLKPRDDLEEMLIMQAIWTHARLAKLSLMANQAGGMESAPAINDNCDGAAKTFRQQIQALIDYRNPRKSGDMFMAIKQANLAQQQVVQNARDAKAGKTVERLEPRSQAAPQALQADAERVGVPAQLHPADPALETVDRPENAAGEVLVETQRGEARHAQQTDGRRGA